MKKYSHFEVEKILDTITILYDTREQPTERLRRRLEDMSCISERIKLDFGDYSCKCTLPDGNCLDFSHRAVIERKMDIDELCTCFGKERKRFENEFDKAGRKGCKVYLIVEDATWEKILNGKYRSMMNPLSLTASIAAWMPRYNMVPIFCKPETTGRMIKEILYRELKEYLMGVDADDQGGDQGGLHSA